MQLPKYVTDKILTQDGNRSISYYSKCYKSFNFYRSFIDCNEFKLSIISSYNFLATVVLSAI